LAKSHVKTEHPGDRRKSKRADAHAQLLTGVAAVEEHGARGPPTKPLKSTDNLAAFTIPEFCRRHGISRSTFYNLRRTGQGPRETRIGRRIIITAAHAAAWLKSGNKQTKKTA
jgi:predicted DNA-binding transcriptional regulator AlpA